MHSHIHAHVGGACVCHMPLEPLWAIRTCIKQRLLHDALVRRPLEPPLVMPKTELGAAPLAAWCGGRGRGGRRCCCHIGSRRLRWLQANAVTWDFACTPTASDPAARRAEAHAPERRERTRSWLPSPLSTCSASGPTALAGCCTSACRTLMACLRPRPTAIALLCDGSVSLPAGKKSIGARQNVSMDPGGCRSPLSTTMQSNLIHSHIRTPSWAGRPSGVVIWVQSASSAVRPNMGTMVYCTVHEDGSCEDGGACVWGATSTSDRCRVGQGAQSHRWERKVPPSSSSGSQHALHGCRKTCQGTRPGHVVQARMRACKGVGGVIANWGRK